jgi:hypothetical protein
MIGISGSVVVVGSGAAAVVAGDRYPVWLWQFDLLFAVDRAVQFGNIQISLDRRKDSEFRHDHDHPQPQSFERYFSGMAFLV